VPPSGHPNSYYVATANPMPEHARLRGALKADVCIIGGGYTGLSTLLHLAERGFDAVLLEAARVGAGASGRNGGQIGSGQRQDQRTLEAWCGEARARALWELGEEAKATVKELTLRHAIDCELKPGILGAAWKPQHADWLRENVDHLERRYGYRHARFVPADEMADMLGTTRYFGGALDLDAAHLHPLNYALGLARGAIGAGGRIFEHSRVTRIGKGPRPLAETEEGTVEARHLVLAMNGYLGRLEPRLAGKIMPLNNFIVATEPLPEARARSLIRDDVAVFDTKFVLDYFRLSADRRLLFGGGESYRQQFPDDIAALVRPCMLRIFPQLEGVRIDYAWGGRLAITRNRMPHFGRPAADVFVAHGYSGHGVGMATLAGKLIGEAVAGTAERFDVMASLDVPSFPGGTLLRWPALVLAMLYYGLRDRL
jgi:gamma-glutamylputrescine oxidase